MSSVTDMSHMFLCAKSFNQPVGNWDVSKVTDMKCIFNHARAFNQPLGNWNVSIKLMFIDPCDFHKPVVGEAWFDHVCRTYKFSTTASVE